MPLCFQSKKVAVIIINCFEIFIERPSNLQARSQIIMNTTIQLRYFLDVRHKGVISYVSSAWGGWVSDKYLTKHCGLLDHLIPGDVASSEGQRV